MLDWVVLEETLGLQIMDRQMKGNRWEVEIKDFVGCVSLQDCPTRQILHLGLEDKVILIDRSTRNITFSVRPQSIGFGAYS